jgi:hypothetical protein
MIQVHYCRISHVSWFIKSTIITTYRGVYSKEHGKYVLSMSQKYEIELVDKQQWSFICGSVSTVV